ncbi:hypothetical protein BJX62DRAFT_194502, partial [Aspergillus germanicus]
MRSFLKVNITLIWDSGLIQLVLFLLLIFLLSLSLFSIAYCFPRSRGIQITLTHLRRPAHTRS